MIFVKLFTTCKRIKHKFTQTQIQLHFMIYGKSLKGKRAFIRAEICHIWGLIFKLATDQEVKYFSKFADAKTALNRYIYE